MFLPLFVEVLSERERERERERVGKDISVPEMVS
jgi:hypothetical protein